MFGTNCNQKQVSDVVEEAATLEAVLVAEVVSEAAVLVPRATAEPVHQLRRAPRHLTRWTKRRFRHWRPPNDRFFNRKSSPYVVTRLFFMAT